MREFEGLPDSRTSLRGLTPEGDEAWVNRAISQKLYRCPGCGGAVEVGAEHVVVQLVRRGGGGEHAHWHSDCAEERVVLGLRDVRPVSARVARRLRG
jgi:hypothetical protein